MDTITKLLYERMNFVQRNIALGRIVGYYPDDDVNARLRVIKLSELVCFDNALVVGTNWDNYEPITDRILYAYKSNGSPAEALVVPEALKQLVAKQQKHKEKEKV